MFPFIVGEPVIVILLSPYNVPPSLAVELSVKYSVYPYPPPYTSASIVPPEILIFTLVSTFFP